MQGLAAWQQAIATPPTAGRIVIANPNSSASVTALIAETLAGFAGPKAPDFSFLTLAESPATIVTDADVTLAGARLNQRLAGLAPPAALVIACFSDPGLVAARAQLPCPVIGIQEAAVLTALGLAPRFGIIALSQAPIARHRRKLAAMGVLDRLALEVGLSGVSAHDAGHREDLYPEILAAGRALQDAGAGAVVLGCAGFGSRRARLEADLGLPVIDPVLAGAAMALAVA